jgi:exonuclease-1
LEHTDARAAGGVERHGAGLFDRVRPPRTAAMGISSLLPSLRSIVRTKHVGEAYGGKRVAVDSYCWLHRGAYSCSVELVEGIPTDKFVTSFMKRAHMLRRCNVEAVYVFDGGRMPGKADEEADRRRARVEAKQKARAHKRAGNEVAANEMYQRAVDVSPEMALAVIEALKKDGFSTVVAPYEADAQMAYLVRHGFVDGVVTEDSDLVPHRCASVFFKMDNDGMGQEIRYADVVANRDLSFAGFTPDQFLEMCVMSGCDYLPSLPGVGIKKAHALMRRFKKHDAALRSLRFEGTPVPKKYEQGFKDALNVFKHQWVFCPVRLDMAHLSSAPPRGDDAENGERERDAYSSVDPPLSREDASRLIGPRHSKETARGVADGALHPMTLEAYAPLPTSGAPKHRNPSVASFFPGASKPRPRSADAVRETDYSYDAHTSALASASTPRFRAHPASADAADAADRTETEKTPCAVRTEPPRAPERWVTPPALTAANPSKRAFYALLRASPSRAVAESPLESRFGVRPATEKESPGKTAKRSRRTAVGLEGPRTRQNPDDVADADEAAATAHRAAEKREATEPPRAAAHPFYLTPRSTPASARSRYFAAPGVPAPPSTTRVSSPGRAEAAEAASDPAEASAARSEARAEKENETTATTTTTTTTAKKPLFERFAFGAK